MPDHRGVIGRAAADRLAARYGARVVLHGAVDSTMEAAGRDAGVRPVVHIATSQSAGRGRRGRPWASPAGNLYATICWPDPDAAMPAGLLAAIQLAWAEAVLAAGGPDARCKWPNDGLVAGKKWAGVLALRLSGPHGPEMRVGLGANLEAVPEDLGPDALPPTALVTHWPDWPGCEAVATSLVAAALDVLRDGPTGIVARLTRWPDRDALARDEPIRIGSEGGDLIGSYAGVAPDGRLRLRIEGAVRTVASGQVDRLRSGIRT